MGIITQVTNTKKINVRKCHINIIARMELACVLREGLMSFMCNIS